MGKIGFEVKNGIIWLRNRLRNILVNAFCDTFRESGLNISSCCGILTREPLNKMLTVRLVTCPKQFTTLRVFIAGSCQTPLEFYSLRLMGLMLTL